MKDLTYPVVPVKNFTNKKSISRNTKDMSDLAAAILRFPPGRAGDLHHVNIPLWLGHGARPLECQLIMMIMIMISASDGDH